MRHSVLLVVLGILLGLAAWTRGTAWSWIGLWLSADLILLGLAYSRRDSAIFGKQPDGSLSLGRVLLFLPWLLFTWGVWRLSLMLPEPKAHQINDRLTIGRRLLGQERLAGITTILDMTAEFPESAAIRNGVRYLCLPTLDACAPASEALLDIMRQLKPDEQVFIHCAQGHGRTGMAAIALLLHRRIVQEIEEGLIMLRNIRPGIGLSMDQRACLEKCLSQLRL